MVGIANFVTCPGCGAYVEALEEPVHGFFGAAAGCWKVYGMVLEREYGEYQCPEDAHRLTVDAYAAQHPGKPGPREQRLVNSHLMSLYLYLEQGADHGKIVQAVQALNESEDDLPWLTPPKPIGKRTVLDVLKAKSLEEHTAAVDAWARDVWAAWSPHHGHTAELAARYGG